MLWRSALQISSCLLSLAAGVAAVANDTHHPTIYLIRHGEKSGDPNDHELTFEGVMRAQCLRDVFGAASKYNISYIMAPAMEENGEHGRALKTALPLANDLGLEVDVQCGKRMGDLELQCVADASRSYDGPGNVLLVWRHKSMSTIAELLGVREHIKCPKNSYDLIWTIPYPYDRVTELKSENCPGLDVDIEGLIVQY
ncbi:hypothetical protein N7494_011696 [Penicillium frequentans]|uniref:Phosphoglycerate mutase family protein n=1 Tax=Penicillium frequentans TaxID=3151616 RepID=A0AAD6CKR0_9EURO|nr:hypothetical protein N7494_011696 [Penicillium glabrum]